MMFLCRYIYLSHSQKRTYTLKNDVLIIYMLCYTFKTSCIILTHFVLILC